MGLGMSQEIVGGDEHRVYPGCKIHQEYVVTDVVWWGILPVIVMWKCDAVIARWRDMMLHSVKSIMSRSRKTG
jgi:hypothetical protein